MEKLFPKLTPREKLDLVYEMNIRLFRGIVEQNPLLVSDPNAFTVGYDFVEEADGKPGG